MLFCGIHNLDTLNSLFVHIVVFSEATLFSLVGGCQLFRGTYCLYLQISYPYSPKKKGDILFIYGTVISSNFCHQMMKSLMKNELNMMSKGWSWPTFEASSQNLTRVTEENHTKPWSGQLISGLRFKFWTSSI